MQKYRRLWFIGAMAMLLLTAAGCFQAAGTAPESQSVAENTNPTWTPFPSDTPFPTIEPQIVTATQDPNLFIAPTQDFGQSPSVAQFPTQDPALAQFPTQDPALAQFPTQDPALAQFPTQDLNSFAQVPTLDPFAAQAQVNQNLDPIYVTATYIVARATMTEAYFMTATAGGPLLTPIIPPTMFPIGAPTATLAPVPGGSCTYTVSAGENLFRISMKYNMTPQELAAANGIPNMNLILVGQVLTIPNCGATTLPATPIPAGVTPVGTGQTYTVVQGDTLYTISVRYGVPVASIAAANGISNMNVIVVGQELTIPPA